MGWPHDDTWEVSLVLRVLDSLRSQSEYVDAQSGEKRHRMSFIRERSISRYEKAAGKRFDFSVMVDNGVFRREFLIEVHGKQHYQTSSSGCEVRESDHLKAEWAAMYDIPLLILPDHEVVSLHLEDELEARIRVFLGISIAANNS